MIKENSFCAIGFNNKFRLLFLQMHLLFSGRSVYIYSTIFFKMSSVRHWFVKKRKITLENKGIGEVKGLLYKVHKEALKFTNSFFTAYLHNSSLFRHMNRSLESQKFENFIKKKLAFDIYDVLTNLYLVKEFSREKKIVLIDTPLNRYTVKEFSNNNAVNYEIRWLDFSCFYVIEAFIYYCHIFNILLHGVTCRDKKAIKLYKEAAWGFSGRVLRDDFLIDNVSFKKEDIVFYSRFVYEMGHFSKNKIKDAGYTVVDMNKCSLNVKHDLSLFIRIHIAQPFWLLLTSGKGKYLFEYILKFYIESLPHFLFLTNYKARCHISTSDYGEIAETIIMNRFGCKNLLCHWSDMTSMKNLMHAFNSHNVFYLWGPIHHDFQKEDYFHDKVETVGCVYLKAYYDHAAGHNNDKMNKRILMCDTSFGNAIGYSDEFYLDYLDLAIKLVTEMPDIELMFKPKNFEKTVLRYFSADAGRKKYLDNIRRLRENSRFYYIDNTVQLEPLISASDIVITMGMTSPSTIALILRKEAVYYDPTGNDQHPMTRYMNSVVFGDKERLVARVREILDNKSSVFDYIDPALLNSYEPYKDSKALERLIAAVYRETEEPYYAEKN